MFETSFVSKFILKCFTSTSSFIFILLFLCKVFLQWESANRYVIKNSMGQQVYFAAEGL